MALYGRPVERWFEYQVSRDSLIYWQQVTSRRPGEVVLVLRLANGRYLVHTKDFYPRGTYRLLSGGLKPNEDLLVAVSREAAEETGLQVSIRRFLAILHHRFLHGEEAVCFVSYMFLLQDEAGDSSPHPRDLDERISGFRKVEADGLLELAEALEALPPEWADWGMFRASAQWVAWELLRDYGNDERCT